jgi:hypothetical protein
MKHQTPSQNESRAYVNRLEKMPMMTEPRMAMLWLLIWIFWRYLVMRQPVTIAKDRQLNKKEYYVSIRPVSALRYGMKGPKPEMQAPYAAKLMA